MAYTTSKYVSSQEGIPLTAFIVTPFILKMKPVAASIVLIPAFCGIRILEQLRKELLCRHYQEKTG
jgi:hypothetical protein